MILRIAVALAALADLAIVRVLPESGAGLFLRLGAATIVVLLPGGLVADALGIRLTSATLVWSLVAAMEVTTVRAAICCSAVACAICETAPVTSLTNVAKT